jgi:hypothetical protein
VGRILHAAALASLVLAADAAADGIPAARVLAADEVAAWGAIRLSLSIRTSVDGGRPSARRAVAVERGQRLALSLEAEDGVGIRWYLVLPDLSRNYANAAPPWETNAYAWTGMDSIGYVQIELVGLRDRAEIEPFTGSAIPEALSALDDPRGFYHADVGTFRFAADVTRGGRTARTPGAVENTDRGIASAVTRVTVRGGPGYLGFLEGFYNVAGLFGSTTYQATRHVGADCADILTAAHAEWHRRTLATNRNVQQLARELRRVAEIDVADGVPSRSLRWGETVEPGDFIAVRYEGFRKFVHIGALARDDDGDGVLGAGDLILHAGPDPLHPTRLGCGAFDGHVVILRPAGIAAARGRQSDR